MNVRLHVLSPGSFQGKSIPIRAFPFVIGRSPDCHLRAASPHVSRKHCALLMREGKLVAQDLQSAGGTLVNDQPIKDTVELQHAQRLQIGPMVFEVLLDEGQGEAGEAQPAAEVLTEEEAAALLLSSTGRDLASSNDFEDSSDREKSPAESTLPPDSPNTTNAAAEILRKYQHVWPRARRSES
jgi:pSer/pThr/pTyr-binding forkhead associated (FHA) protein